MNILIIRLSAIGDIVMATPLIDALTKRYPEARISWCVQPESAPLLKEHPGLERVFVWDRKNWQQLLRKKHLLKLYQSIRDFRRQLRDHEFDMVLDCQGLLKSGFLAWLSGAPRRVGLGSKEGSRLFMTERVERKPDDDLIGSEYRDLATALGCVVDQFPMQLATHEDAEQKAKLLLAKTDRYVVICPFTTRPQKHWLNNHWLELIGLLRAKGLSVVMLGGPADVEEAEEIAGTGQVINFVGKTDLQMAVVVIRQASLLIGVDTGLTHMGIAEKIPVITLFGSTRPYLKTENENARVIYHDLSCAPCRRNPVCDGAFTCMREILPIEVMTHADEMVVEK